jgi:hypothetical protein
MKLLFKSNLYKNKCFTNGVDIKLPVFRLFSLSDKKNKTQVFISRKDISYAEKLRLLEMSVSRKDITDSKKKELLGTTTKRRDATIPVSRIG